MSIALGRFSFPTRAQCSGFAGGSTTFSAFVTPEKLTSIQCHWVAFPSVAFARGESPPVVHRYGFQAPVVG
jgi:hypothetical protein